MEIFVTETLTQLTGDVVGYYPDNEDTQKLKEIIQTKSSEYLVGIFKNFLYSHSDLLTFKDFLLIQGWMKTEKYNKFTLIYKGTRDGLSAEAFHKLCDGKGPTISVYKSDKDKIFGGYNPEKWIKGNDFINTDKAFLFSLTGQKKYECIDSKYAVESKSHGGPSFGYTDLEIRFNREEKSAKKSYNLNSPEEFTGGHNFRVVELEVYLISEIKEFDELLQLKEEFDRKAAIKDLEAEAEKKRIEQEKLKQEEFFADEKNKIEKYEAEKRVLAQKKDNLIKSNNDLSNRLFEAEKTFRILKHELKKAEFEQNLSKKFTSLNSEQIQMDVDKMEADIKELTKQLWKFEDEIENLKDPRTKPELELNKKELEEKISEMEFTIEKWKKGKGWVDEFKITYDALNKSFKEAQEKKTGIEAEIKRNCIESDNLDLKTSELTENIKITSDIIEKKKEELSNSEKEQKISEENEKNIKALSEMKVKLERLREREKKIQEAIKLTENALAEFTKTE